MKKVKAKIALAVDSLFHGFAAAEHEITGPQSSSDEAKVVQNIGVGGVFNDLLETKETEAVKELRDKYYRVYRKSDEYLPEYDIITTSNGDKDFVLKGFKKKDSSFFVKHPPVFEEEDCYKLRTIQDNKHVVNKNGFVGVDDELPDDYFGHGLYDYQTTLTVHREEGVIPSFELDKFVTRMVVRNSDVDEKRAKVDLYLPTMASQFGKIDAILISKLHKMYETRDYRANFVEFTGIEWYSDKAWGAKDVELFKYENPKLTTINTFDGSFVLTYICDIVSDGFDLAEQYKTEALDEKYENEAPKKEQIDMYTIERKIERDKKKNKENKDVANENSDRPK